MNCVGRARSVPSIRRALPVSAITHALPLALCGLALGGINPAGFLVVAALACRFILQSEIDRAFHLRDEFFWLGPLRDLLSFAIFIVSFCGRAWSGAAIAMACGPTTGWLITARRKRDATLFLQAPSFDGFDGGAGSRYQMKRDAKSFWFPTWLAQAAAMVRPPSSSTRHRMT